MCSNELGENYRVLVEFFNRRLQQVYATSQDVKQMALDAVLDEVGLLAQRSDIHGEGHHGVGEHERGHAYRRRSVFLLVTSILSAPTKNVLLWTCYRFLILNGDIACGAVEQKQRRINSVTACHREGGADAVMLSERKVRISYTSEAVGETSMFDQLERGEFSSKSVIPRRLRCKVNLSAWKDPPNMPTMNEKAIYRREASKGNPSYHLISRPAPQYA